MEIRFNLSNEDVSYIFRDIFNNQKDDLSNEEINKAIKEVVLRVIADHKLKQYNQSLMIELKNKMEE